MRYTISEMASLLGVTTHTLRYYEKMGLIRPEVNEETGYRYYTVTDTRRFNLCRELRAAELSLEECRELIGSPSVEQSDKMFARQAARLRRRQVLDELSIHFLEKMQEQYRTLEQDVGRVWVQNFPEMWRLTFSQEEEASRDRELQQEKAEWLECMPATRWVSRLPRRVTLKVFTGCQTINQCFVQFSPRMIINCCNARIWLLKFSLADQPFQTIVFTVAVFDINKHTEPILERHFLHCRIIHLDAECIRHSSQTHFNKFIDCTLICHDCLPP